MPLGVSVIICTYNGATRIPETLRHLGLQQVPRNIQWEIILIDNASTDDTSIVAKEEWSKYNIHNVDFKVLQEELPGKSYAFAKGIKAAEYEYILTCDDDNWLYPNYIFTAFNIMQSDPSIGVLGGCGIFEPEQPMWPEIQKFKISYVNGPQIWAATDHWVYGAGSVYKKNVLVSFYEQGWVNITAGRTGTKQISGEDVEICFMFFLSGYKIMANNQLLFKHYVPVNRQNLNYILNLHFWQSYSYVMLSSYIMLIDQDKQTIQKKIDNWFIFILKALIVQVIKSTYQKLTARQSENIDQIFAQQSYYGAIYSIYQNRKKIINNYHHIKYILNKDETADSLIHKTI